MVSKVVSPWAVKVGWKWVSCGQESKAQRCVLRDPFAMLTPGAENEKSELFGTFSMAVELSFLSPLQKIEKLTKFFWVKV